MDEIKKIEIEKDIESKESELNRIDTTFLILEERKLTEHLSDIQFDFSMN